MSGTTTAMSVAWHNNPDLKAEVVARMHAHRAADTVVQGLYQEIAPETATGYRGCFIGCTLPRQDDGEPLGGWHAEVERLYGIPRAVGLLADRIFEGLPKGEHAQFAVGLLEAVPVGADLSLVASRMIIDMLVDVEHGVVRHTAEGSDQRAAVQTVAALHRRRLAGDEPNPWEWRAASAAAHAAAHADHAAADAAAYAAAYAAYAAADADAADHAAADAAADADADADAAAAHATARRGHWQWTATRLIHHVSTASGHQVVRG